ncbi:MAG: dTMP kinase [Saccharofermentanales bacterium]|nr:dTMP kinase [Clostridiaceae bacterium]
MLKGKLITFEGIDGSGKSTQITLLSDYLLSLGYRVVLLREPGGTEIGERIRQILLDMRHDNMTAETELFLFEAARAQLTREVLIPALESGAWVISDRFSDSSVAYQGYGRGLSLEMIRSMNTWATAGVRPDLTILLELGDRARDQRLRKRHVEGEHDRLDIESERFKQRVCEGFREIASEEPTRVVVVESQGEKEDTAALIREEVKRLWQ